MKSLSNLAFVGFLAGLLGCGSGDDQPDVVGTDTSTSTSTSTGAVSCLIPVTAGHGKLDPKMYLRIEGDVPCAPDAFWASSGETPSDCNSPVDGFASWGNVNFWCVKTVPVSGSKDVRSIGLEPLVPGWGSGTPGHTALCSSSGTFMGWACLD